MGNTVRFPHKIPEIFTSRLVLRELTLADAPSYFAFCSNAEVMRTWGTPVHVSLDQSRQTIVYLREQFEKQLALRFGIFLAPSGQLIGDVGFWRFVNERARAEAGAKLDQAYWRNGYMAEALSALVGFGFHALELNSVEANIDPANSAALHLVQKLGFQKEGFLRAHSWNPYQNLFCDTELHSLHQKDWKPCHTLLER